MADGAPNGGERVVTRFAPAPTGYLHRGHAYSAHLNFSQARSAAGRFVLRIEDIDRRRCRPEYQDAALEDLHWLGIEWDGEPLRQSERLDRYESHLVDLHERGLVYRCFRQLSDVADSVAAPHRGPGGTFRGAALAAMEERDNLAQGRPFAWRLSLDAAAAELGDEFETLSFAEEAAEGIVVQPANAGRFGDVVLGRRDTGTTYHLSSVVDDAAQGVTHVTRGEELREAAGLHALLYRLLALPSPVFRHHRMITDAVGRRLSKRDGDVALRTIRRSGTSPQELIAGLG